MHSAGVVKAVLFDLDGTLIDSESFHFASWNELLSAYGVSLDINEYLKSFAGVSVPENARRLIQTYGIDVPVGTLIATRERIYLEKVSSQSVMLMPFVLETLQFFKTSGVSIGLVTSSTRREVDLFLAKSGFSDFFSVIITRNDVHHVKPHPDPYLIASQSLGFAPEEYLVFEDTVVGVTSASRAGLLCFAIKSDPSEAEQLRGIADHTFSTLDDARKFLIQGRYLMEHR